MRNVLNLGEAPPAIEQSFKAATKLKNEMESIPLNEMFISAKDIGVRTYEASHNTYLDMQEFLGIEKALKTIQVEQGNNKSRLIRKERY